MKIKKNIPRPNSSYYKKKHNENLIPLDSNSYIKTTIEKPRQLILSKSKQNLFKPPLPSSMETISKITLFKKSNSTSKLDLFITPDTGPFHIAIAVKTPTISLYGSTKRIEVYPNYDQEIHKFVEKPIICKKCFERKCICQKGMRQIKPSEVYEKIKEFGLLD